MNQNEIKKLCDQYGLKYLNHMTHIDNVGSIIEHGLLCSNAVDLQSIPHTSIADPNIQGRRGASIRTVDGEDKMIDLHDYVPLFIAKHTPMQYIVTTSAPTKGRDIKASEYELVFILINPISVMQLPGMLIANGNAAKGATQFSSTPAGLSELDWDTIKSPNESPQWFNPNWIWKKPSEILVPKKVPFSFMTKLVVNSETARTKLISKLSDKLKSGVETSHLRDRIEIDTSYYSFRSGPFLTRL